MVALTSIPVPTSSARAERWRRRFDAIVLAGPRSERLGGVDKAMIDVGGSTLIDRVLAGLEEARLIVAVGPARAVARQVRWCEEQPPGGGPVAAFSAGIAACEAQFVLLLAADLPFVSGAVPALIAGLTEGVDVAVLVDDSGRPNYLASAWRRTSAESRLAGLGNPTGLSMKMFFDGLTIAEVVDDDDWGTDCDTWVAIEQARVRATYTGGPDD